LGRSYKPFFTTVWSSAKVNLEITQREEIFAGVFEGKRPLCVIIGPLDERNIVLPSKKVFRISSSLLSLLHSVLHIRQVVVLYVKPPAEMLLIMRGWGAAQKIFLSGFHC